ncbi:MAG: competence protein CoiA family protein [Paenisporosarcina sp.]
MLTAYNDKKEIFTITSHLTTDTLLHLRKSMTFYCPQCENPVRLKIGQVMIPHFAHIVLNDCLSSFSERESPIHLKGKLQLAEFFHELGTEVLVESYLPQIAQRPDILVKLLQQSYAIEFQCSTIPIHHRDLRSSGYMKLSIQPIWILRSFDYPKTPSHGIVIIQLTHYRQAFIQESEQHESSIISYDPNRQQFTYYAHLMHLQGTRFVAKILNLPIHVQSFPFRQIKPLTKMERIEYWRVFQRHRMRFLRNRLLTSRKGVNDPFLRICYFNLIHPIDLPLFIGVPLGNAKHLKSSFIEWQLDFIHLCMQHRIQF